MTEVLIEVSSAEFNSDRDRYLREVACGRSVSVTAPSGSFLITPVAGSVAAEVVNFAAFVSRAAPHREMTLVEMLDHPPSYDIDFEPPQLGSIFRTADLP